MSTKQLALKAAIVVVVCCVGWAVYRLVVRVGAERDVSGVQPSKTGREALRDGKPRPAAGDYRARSLQSNPVYSVLSGTRTRAADAAAPAVQETPPLVPRPILIGVSVSGNERLAVLLDPAAPVGQPQALTRRLGDSYRGYTVTEITENMLVLESGQRREVIALEDMAQRPEAGGETAAGNPRVVPFGTMESDPDMVAFAYSAPAAVTAPPAPQDLAATSVFHASTGPALTQSGQADASRAASAAASSVPESSRQYWGVFQHTDQQGRKIIQNRSGDKVLERPPKP